LGGFDDDVFFFFAVGVAASIFSVLFAASFAAVALTTIGGANARQVHGYEQEAKPNLKRLSLWQCGQVSVCVIGMNTFYNHPLPKIREEV
jgi:hypothetical protein